jgi:hypothetical protein
VRLDCGGFGDFHQDTAFQKGEGPSSRRETLGGRRGTLNLFLRANRTICAIPQALALSRRSVLCRASTYLRRSSVGLWSFWPLLAKVYRIRRKSRCHQVSSAPAFCVYVCIYPTVHRWSVARFQFQTLFLAKVYRIRRKPCCHQVSSARKGFVSTVVYAEIGSSRWGRVSDFPKRPKPSSYRLSGRVPHRSCGEVGDESFMPATLSNSWRVARLTNCRNILPSTTTIVLRRNCSIVCRSPMRKGDR